MEFYKPDTNIKTPVIKENGHTVKTTQVVRLVTRYEALPFSLPINIYRTIININIQLERPERAKIY